MSDEERGTPYACPVCGGQGHLSKPPWVPGDVSEWLSTSIETYPCTPCNGTGLVWREVPHAI